MRTFGRIETGFWQRPKIRALSERARHLMLYLLSCPHGNSVGCFLLPKGYIAADLTWDPQIADTYMAELVIGGHIRYCEATGLLWIVGWFGHNKIENRNVAKAAVATVKVLPTKSPVFSEFLSDLEARMPEFNEAASAEIEPAIRALKKNCSATVSLTVTQTVPKPITNGIETVSPNSGNGIETKEPSLSLAREGSVAKATGADAPPIVPIETPKDRLWREALPYLQRHGTPEKQARGLVGKWLKGRTPDIVVRAIIKAQTEQVIDPVPYIERLLSGPGQSPSNNYSPGML